MYVGYVPHPLTLHWHCSAAERGESDFYSPIGILSAMVEEGIVRITLGNELDSVMLRKNVSSDLYGGFENKCIYVYFKCKRNCKIIIESMISICVPDYFMMPLNKRIG